LVEPLKLLSEVSQCVALVRLTRLNFVVRWLIWSRLAARKEGGREEKGEGLSAAERDEISRLRRENKQLRVERDILSRAAAWFARETGAVPFGSSNS